MKNKYLLIKLAGVGFLILLAAAYLLVYFLPTLETINTRRRELKDLNLSIQNLLDTEKRFAFPNDAETELFKVPERELRRRIPEIRGKEEYFRHFTKVFDYIKHQARRDGVRDLAVNSASSELELNATSLYADENSLRRLLNFTNTKLTELQKQLRGNAVSPVAADGGPVSPAPAKPAPLLPNLDYQTVYLSFCADLKPALNFINHLPWGGFYLRPAEIMVSAGPDAPYFLVFLRVYYFDQRESGDRKS